MTESHGHHHGKHRSSARRESPQPGFVRANLFEIIGVAAIALGIFLIFERMSIRMTLSRWAAIGGTSLLAGLGYLDSVANNLIARIGLADVVGLLLMLGALIAILLRLRWRLERTPSLTTLCCPRCGGAIHRIHRRTSDRLLGWFVPVRRYLCSNPECRWSGLRVSVRRGGHDAAPTAPPAARGSAR